MVRFTGIFSALKNGIPDTELRRLFNLDSFALYKKSKNRFKVNRFVIIQFDFIKKLIMVTFLLYKLVKLK